jgi:hypothetical protein
MPARETTPLSGGFGFMRFDASLGFKKSRHKPPKGPKERGILKKPQSFMSVSHQYTEET